MSNNYKYIIFMDFSSNLLARMHAEFKVEMLILKTLIIGLFTKGPLTP